MKKFISIFIVIFLIDRVIKYLFVNGLEFDFKCISFMLVYNDGVAFSMLSFLQGYLKYLQIFLLILIFIYLFKNKEIFYKYSIAIALILAGGISNIFDRFIYEGVVDYIYWHCWFDFAIFNFADMMIDLGVLLILLKGNKE